MALGERLKSARKQAGMSQAELAESLCSLSYISHVEAGRRSPGADLIAEFEKRLGLNPGLLASAASSPVVTGTAELAELAASAREYLRCGVCVDALESAVMLVDQAKIVEATPMVWTGLELCIDAYVGLGRYSEALQAADRMTALLDRNTSPTLRVRTLLVGARAALLARHDRAVDLAEEAMHFSRDLPFAHDLRVRSLNAVLAVSSRDLSQRLTELESCFGEIGNSDLAGKAAWVMGNHAFADGKIDAGLMWHGRAKSLLSPATDFRNYARFLRSSANQRLLAGVMKDVPELLEQASSFLAILGDPGELAELAETQARFEYRNQRYEAAERVLQEGLVIEDLSPQTQASLHLLWAEVASAQKQAIMTKEHALKAARLFTGAGALTQAEKAWSLIDLADAQV